MAGAVAGFAPGVNPDYYNNQRVAGSGPTMAQLGYKAQGSGTSSKYVGSVPAKAPAPTAASSMGASGYSGSGGGGGGGGYSASAPSLPAYSSVFAPTYNTQYGGGSTPPVSIGDSLGAPALQGLNQALNPAAGWQADQGVSPGQQGLGTRTPSMGIDTLRQIVSRAGRVY